MNKTRIINCNYGRPGHEREYVITINGFNLDNYIPLSISEELQRCFPNTTVLNRGSRIEIMTDTALLTEAIILKITQIFESRPWLEEMRTKCLQP